MRHASTPAMHLAALSAGGQAARGRFNGTVHSVFRQACNIRLDDGRMLALLAPDLGNVPHGVRLDAPAGFAFSSHLAVGRRVGCRADVLRVAGGLSVDLGSAQAWHGGLPAANIDPMVPEVARAWRAAWQALRRGRRSADHPDERVLSGAVDRQGIHLARAVRALRADEAARALERLIGRGAGLTPAGDDLVTGFLAGLFSTTGDDRAPRAFLEAFCLTVAAASAATTDISRAYLTQAAAGWFAEPLVTLARQIGAGADRGAIESATSPALRVGHTSGRAGVFGLLLGLVTWTPKAVLRVRHTSRGAGVFGLLRGLAARAPQGRAAGTTYLRARAHNAALFELTWPRQLRAGPSLTGQTSCRARPKGPREAHRVAISTTGATKRRLAEC
jgi:hypothetical protein